ncbi:MAG: DUF2279 domain-containing protein [Bacteroidia bacterium]|nr:DUF2279 domain-containing protein [Bacteroidia bacterium]
MKKFILLILLFFICLFEPKLFAQVNDSLALVEPIPAELTTKKKLIITGLVLQQAASMYVEYKWWWEGNYHPFVIYSDGWFEKNSYSLGVDKAGHFYTSYMYFNVLNELLKWGEFDNRTSLILSTSIPFVWALSIEIGDGFSNYNFSQTDLLANSLGITYGLLQAKIPFLQNFKFKFSYYPSSYYQKNNFKDWSLTADYDGHIYWLSMDVHNILPHTAKKYWLKYLNLSIGYGMEGFAKTNDEGNFNKINYKERKFCIGLDWNLSAFTAKNKTLKTALNILDYYHFPAPGVRKVGKETFEFKPLLLN